ncbi:MAG: hypothetical protein JSR80_02055 [Verrucomicrobia bacterium]|nr:hypothetical protein [Verrucomicrobiota bacterium]
MLHRMLNLYPGEGRQAFLFSALIFFVALGMSGGTTLADGNFLEVMGTSFLPFAYFGIAGLMAVVTPLIMLAMGKIAIRPLLLLMLLCSGGIFALTGLLPISWFATKIIADTIFFVILAALWNFIDQSYDMQDAKRHYGLYSAVLICGFAAGSSTISLLIDSLGSRGLLWLLATDFALAASIVVLIIRTTRTLPAMPEEEEATSEKGLVRRIWHSPFTIILLTLSSMIGIAEFLMEFSYMEALETAFGHDLNELTRFLGMARGLTYCGTVFLGAFCFGRLVKRIGVTNVTLIPASYFLLLFSVSSYLPHPVMAILGLLGVECILTAFEDNGFHLILNAVPATVKARLRVVVQNFIEPGAMVVAALLLLAFSGYGKWIGFGFATAAFSAALILRLLYPKAILRNLRENTKRSSETNSTATKITPLWEALANVAGTLQSQNPVERGGAILEALKSNGAREQALAALRELLNSSLDEEACVGLTVLALHGSPHHFDTAIPFLMNPSLEVQRTAMNTLAHLANASARRHGHRIFAELIGSKDPVFRSHCLRALERLCDARYTREMVVIAADLIGREREQAETIIDRFGARAVPTLLAMVTDTSLPAAARLIACRSLKREHLTQLRHLVEGERAEAFLILFHAHMIKSHSNVQGDFGIDLLERMLTERFWTHLEMILHLLVEDAPLVCQALRSANEKVHSHAIESLEKGTPSRLFRQLLPLVDDSPLEPRLKHYQGKVLDLSELLDHLLQGAGAVDKDLIKELQLQRQLKSRLGTEASNGAA